MRAKRPYGLFEKQGDSWVRLYPNLSYLKPNAIKIFQDSLLAPMMIGIDGVKIKGIRELRPVKA